MCYLVCLLQQVQQAQISNPELVPSAQPVQPAQLTHPAVFSSPLLNGSDPCTVTTAAQLDNNNPCQLALQAQSQVQSQIPVLQPSDFQRASSGSASSSLTQQKQLSSLTGAVGQGPTETNAEVWAYDFHILLVLISSSAHLALQIYTSALTCCITVLPL